jgi:hypothetical protein
MFTNGARLTTYENAEGVYNLSGNFNIGLPVNFGQTRANLNLGTMGSYNHNVNFINDEANDINTINITQRVSLNYTFKELFDVSVGGSGNWSDVKYSLQESQNTNYASYGADFETNWYIPKLFTIGTTVAYTANTGRAEGFNPNFTMWNAYLSKSFLKNKKGELRFSVFDILNQNTGVDRNTSGNYVQDTRYTVLKRYAMLSFTYNLSKFGNIGGGGGGGMMRGMQRTMIM